KNIDVEIPRDKLTVITGLSGSGKSSLAFDTIYAEGQRRYVESLSAYARQFLGLTNKPDVDSIDGLSPAISVDQKSASRNPRSTVGTVTEIYDYLRLLFAKIGEPHCPKCGKKIERQTTSQIVDAIAKMPEGRKILLLAPVVVDRKGEHAAEIEKIKKDGFVRYRVDGKIVTISEELKLDPKKKHTIEIVVDRLVVKDLKPIVKKLSDGTPIEQPNPDRSRLADSVELALKSGNGVIKVLGVENPPNPASSAGQAPPLRKGGAKQAPEIAEETSRAGGFDEQIFSEAFACPDCEVSLPEISPRMFSFNSPHGACPECHGLGSKLTVDEKKIIPNPDLSIEEGAILPWVTLASTDFYGNILRAVAEAYDFDLKKPWKKMSKAAQEVVLHGTGDERYEISFNGDRFSGEYSTKFEGVIPNVERRYRETDSDFVRNKLERFMLLKDCEACHGKRLRSDVLGITLNEKNIIETTALAISDARKFFVSLKLSPTEKKIANLILKEIDARLSFLENVGIAYLTLDRAANTLSGGEAQRIRLATQIGSKLQGVLYVLDEPSIGLHQRDNAKLIQTLTELRDLGNSVIVVEHDEEIMREADFIVDIGPGAGRHGGRVVCAGTPKEIMQAKNCKTGEYLSGKRQIETPKKRRKGSGKFLKIVGATEHNLKDVEVKLPLGTFIGVSGVSGSGKSSLINFILAKRLLRDLNRSKDVPGAHKDFIGIENLDKAIVIDQAPIGRTPRSNAATYTGVFTDIRDLFASTPEAKLRGYKSGRFSFNVKGGRCEACGGDGLKKIEMHFLPDIYVECEECHGRRYNREALEITYRSKNIADVLEMTVEDAAEFFTAQPAIKKKLDTLVDVGLGYLKLGQSATTLSGGEAQRIKLATELSKRATGKTLYILDEPTTGLHFDDVKRLIEVLQRLVDAGNTMVVIEHNLDVLKSCDYLIDLGPEGGSAGGEIIASGTPEEVAKATKSFTGQYLKKMLKA
ncbi:MAG: excinuclease ABC subunit UvrA, partial [Candidatus Peribacteraceae bacterium]|nr:excinuclease ABC subunit UvrA [Candidatus Peribacteraceae bacterium]